MKALAQVDPALTFHSNVRHTLEQLSQIDQTLAERKDWSFRHVLEMAQLLSVHGHPSCRPFITWALTQHHHVELNQKLECMLKVGDLAHQHPHVRPLQSDAVFKTALYAHEGFFFSKGDKRPDVLLVVFTTLYNNFGISNLFLYALLKDSGVSVLMLRDGSWANYLGGASDMGDNLDDLAEAIQGFAKAQQCQHLLIMGYSSGGYASYYVSTKVPCAAYLGMSIVTDFSLDSSLPTENFIRKDIRQRFDPKFLVNLATLPLPATHRTARRLLVGQKSKVDLLYTQAMKGVPDLSVIELADCSHDIPEALLASGEFMTHIDWLLAHAR